MNSARIRDSEASQEKILDAAETLFIEQDFNATSLRQVAERAQVAKSLIFHHFQTKADLWDRVKARRMQDFAQRQHEVFDHGEVSLQRFTNAITDYFQLLKQDPSLVQLLVRAELEEEPNCNRFDLHLVGQFIERLERAQAAGLLRSDLRPNYVMALILAAVNHWFEAHKKFSQWPNIAGNPNCDEEYLQSFIDILLYGALPREENKA